MRPLKSQKARKLVDETENNVEANYVDDLTPVIKSEIGADVGLDSCLPSSLDQPLTKPVDIDTDNLNDVAPCFHSGMFLGMHLTRKNYFRNLVMQYGGSRMCDWKKLMLREPAEVFFARYVKPHAFCAECGKKLSPDTFTAILGG